MVNLSPNQLKGAAAKWLQMSSSGLARIFALLFILFLAVPVQGQGKEKTVITIDVIFEETQETFTVAGGALEDLCPTGTAVSEPIDYKLNDPPRPSIFHLYKTLTCENGLGTITIKVQAKSLPGAPTDSGGFSVTGGTGAFEGLHGGGSLVGTLTTYDGKPGIQDVYTGILMD